MRFGIKSGSRQDCLQMLDHGNVRGCIECGRLIRFFNYGVVSFTVDKRLVHMGTDRFRGLSWQRTEIKRDSTIVGDNIGLSAAPDHPDIQRIASQQRMLPVAKKLRRICLKRS